MIVLIDNYDSFSYNLVQVLLACGTEVRVFRNDVLEVDGVMAMNPAGVVISPGPCTPREAGISVPLIRKISGLKPILGVCLGHQAIGAAFGAVIGPAKRIMHGKTSQVRFLPSPLYRGLVPPITVGRYHSLAILPETLPPTLVADAWSEDGEIMGVHHVEHPTYGIQFHPESVLTPCGKRLLRNFLRLVEEADMQPGAPSPAREIREGGES